VCLDLPQLRLMYRLPELIVINTQRFWEKAGVVILDVQAVRKINAFENFIVDLQNNI
jgi:hypothetical protein